MNNEKTQSRGQIIIAEDDFLICEDVKSLLTDRGFSVIATASNGKQAIELTKEHNPDLVLMDIKMPEMDGLEAAKLIQKEHPTPVIILTAHESPEMIKKAMKHGIGAFLTKPPEAGEIERAIQIAIARHKDLMRCRHYSEELKKQKEELEKALAEIKTLQGIIPICMHCKKVRNDTGYWEQVEAYVSNRSDANFSHGICPTCAKEIYGSDLSD